ncbi:protein ripply1 [Engraulis encrasicolus]|uniref:protein ripply1 n=1 Tax=Engraulis encrasicolus TaxID=184585 RepID=UPI002FCED056
MQSVCFVAQETPFVASSRLISSGSSHISAPTSSRAALWRPWLVTGKDTQTGCPRSKAQSPYSRSVEPGTTTAMSKLQPFQHPVRLFWPKSKSYDYLYSDGEALLRNFPVQATISFYEESDSDSDEEDDDCEEEEEMMEAEEKIQSYERVTSLPCFTHVN